MINRLAEAFKYQNKTEFNKVLGKCKYKFIKRLVLKRTARYLIANNNVPSYYDEQYVFNEIIRRFNLEEEI